MTMTRDPHTRSKPFNVDPAYSSTCVLPAANNMSLFCEKTGGDAWVYRFGDIATHLFNRLRREAFTVCKYVCHPGEFRNHHPTLFARTSVSLKRLPKALLVDVIVSGHVRLAVNGLTFITRSFPATPETCAVDLRPFLHAGDNTVTLVINTLGEPPAFLLRGWPSGVKPVWELSTDFVRWGAPELLPCVGVERFPHQEDLPEITLQSSCLGEGLYDFGVETFGRVRVHVSGEGELGLQVGESIPEAQETAFIQKEQLVPPFRRAGDLCECEANLSLRYVQLTHPDSLTVKAVELAAPLCPVRYRGAFACSDEELTNIWMRSAYTYRLCMRELCVDGLKRDRLPWGGDLYMSGLIDNYSFAQGTIIQRSLYALFGEGPEILDVSGIVDYSLFWVMALRDQFLHSGDTLYMTRMLPMLERMLRALDARADETGFLPTRPGDWVFIDWSAVDKAGYSSCIQMLYVLALDAAAEIFTHLEEATRVRELHTQAKQMRKRCDEAFWSDKRSCYVDNLVGGRQGDHLSRPPNIFAVLSGTATTRKQKALLKTVLLNDAVLPTGTPYMRTFEALALAACGRAKEMLSLIRNDWGGMISAGATTFWEGYDKTQGDPEQYSFYDRLFGKSLCHAWSAGPVYLLSQALTGAHPLTPGWERFTLAPQAGGLEWAAVAIPCPQGEIHVELDGTARTVHVPDGTVLVMGKTEHAGPCVVQL